MECITIEELSNKDERMTQPDFVISHFMEVTIVAKIKTLCGSTRRSGLSFIKADVAKCPNCQQQKLMLISQYGTFLKEYN